MSGFLWYCGTTAQCRHFDMDYWNISFWNFIVKWLNCEISKHICMSYGNSGPQWHMNSYMLDTYLVWGLTFHLGLSHRCLKIASLEDFYYSSLIFPTPTTWPFCRPADRHLHVRAWLSLLHISVTMKMTKWKWCEQSWSIRKKKRKKKSTKKTTNWSKQHTLSKLI